MRSFSNKNKTTFIAFGAVVLAGLATMSVLVINQSKNKDDAATVSAGSIIYATDNTIVEVNTDTELTEKWDGAYYYKDDDNQSTSAGTHPIVYNDDEATLAIYGTCYRIYPDGSVKEYPSGLTIDNLKESAVYKLDDRLYVLTGSVIQDFDKNFSVDKFMRVKLDISGSCLMTSYGFSRKTISPIILFSDDLFVDVASELLYSDGQETNMRKVIGSTNTYEDAPILYSDETGIVRPETSTANTQSPDILEYNIKAGDGGDGGDGGQGGVGGKGGTGGTGGIGGLGGTGGDAADNKEDETFQVELYSVDTSETTLTINYGCYEASNNISKVMAYITDVANNTTTTEILSKTQTSYTVYGLSQDTQYKVELAYCTYEVDTDTKSYVSSEPVIANSVTLNTDKSTASLNVVNATRNNDGNVTNVMFNLKLPGYTLDTGNGGARDSYVLVRYTLKYNGTKEEKVYLTSMATSIDGMTISLDINDDDEVKDANNETDITKIVSGIQFINVYGFNGENSYVIPVESNYYNIDYTEINADGKIVKRDSSGTIIEIVE